MKAASSKIMAAALMFGASLGVVGSVQAEGLSKELMRARALDVCIYAEWKRHKDKDVTKACRCASEKWIKGLDKDVLGDVLESGKMSSSQKKDMRTTFAKCLK